MEGSFIGTIVLLIIGLVILYFVIYTAVKDGINKSLVGQFIEKNYDVKEEKNSFLDNDLDSD
ncbi:integral membrane sensor signal transduction histidine kinase [Oceanobacillus picturae]|uniref:Integral membrane sensor signal transduction histidine kinase n=1 Tax=Oceanobacillus picturae TaxID=171693 RepID=A0A0U9HF20_9BACI|nr:hypothetical protein [Oceanobacillus picturae]GAQ17596.1 integral membrane sensor signal transduction histidine kinase [Oceanobacillus picturae]